MEFWKVCGEGKVKTFQELVARLTLARLDLAQQTAVYANPFSQRRVIQAFVQLQSGKPVNDDVHIIHP